jgi:hypothetical protein
MIGVAAAASSPLGAGPSREELADAKDTFLRRLTEAKLWR